MVGVGQGRTQAVPVPYMVQKGEGVVGWTYRGVYVIIYNWCMVNPVFQILPHATSLQLMEEKGDR